MLSFMSAVRELSMISRSPPNTCTVLTGHSKGIASGLNIRPSMPALQTTRRLVLQTRPDCCDFFLKAANTPLDLR